VTGDHDDTTMHTLRRADGESIEDEGRTFLVIDDDDHIRDDHLCDGAWRPVELWDEHWTVTERRSRWAFPPLADCDLEDCDEDAAGWTRTADGEWHQYCNAHSPSHAFGLTA
jgi:hypothetical protein